MGELRRRAGHRQRCRTAGVEPWVGHHRDFRGVGQLVDAEVEVGAGVSAEGGLNVHAQCRFCVVSAGLRGSAFVHCARLSDESHGLLMGNLARGRSYPRVRLAACSATHSWNASGVIGVAMP